MEARYRNFFLKWWLAEHRAAARYCLSGFTGFRKEDFRRRGSDALSRASS